LLTGAAFFLALERDRERAVVAEVETEVGTEVEAEFEAEFEAEAIEVKAGEAEEVAESIEALGNADRPDTAGWSDKANSSDTAGWSDKANGSDAAD
jgi:hypothetical protein